MIDRHMISFHWIKKILHFRTGNNVHEDSMRFHSQVGQTKLALRNPQHKLLSYRCSAQSAQNVQQTRARSIEDIITSQELPPTVIALLLVPTVSVGISLVLCVKKLHKTIRFIDKVLLAFSPSSVMQSRHVRWKTSQDFLDPKLCKQTVLSSKFGFMQIKCDFNAVLQDMHTYSRYLSFARQTPTMLTLLTNSLCKVARRGQVLHLLCRFWRAHTPPAGVTCFWLAAFTGLLRPQRMCAPRSPSCIRRRWCSSSVRGGGSRCARGWMTSRLLSSWGNWASTSLTSLHMNGLFIDFAWHVFRWFVCHNNEAFDDAARCAEKAACYSNFTPANGCLLSFHSG